MSEEDSSSSEEMVNPDIYRFGGQRGSWRGPSTCGPDEWIPQLQGLYTYPNGDQTDPPDLLEIPR